MLTRNFGSVIDESGKRKKKRRRQSLDLFVYQNPKDKNQREHNKSVNSLAENIRAKALVDYANNKHCFEDLEKQKASEPQWFLCLAKEAFKRSRHRRRTAFKTH